MAVKIPIQKVKGSRLDRRSGGTAVSVSWLLLRPSILLYYSDVQDLIYIANVTVGGVHLWVFPAAAPLPNATDSYGIGWAYGQIAYAQAEFAGISVPQQAYLNVSVAQNPALSYSASGVFGLGFDSLSTIDAVINKTGASTGRTLLYNLFQDNPSEPNFIAFSLQGTFAVGETDPQYANVTNTNKIPTWPVSSPSRWTVLLDSFIVGTQTNDVSSTVSGVPSNKAVVLLDSGTSYTYAPVDVCTAIYGGVAGAQYDSSIGQWVVPCDAEIDMALQIDNQIYPLNPLDVTPTTPGDNSTCVGSFLPQTDDWLIGDNVLRSMLALVDPNQASAEFHAARGGTPLTNITYNVSNSGSGVTTVSLSTDVADTIAKLSQYLPAMLGVMALNALVLTVLTIVGLVLLCRRRGKARARKTPGRLSPMPLSYTSMNRHPDMPEPGPHTYEPVSMALTEDTLFAPPSPAFKGEARYLERPKSIA
ncbi:aspartic peptidase domain-containing protein [Pisolithus croceorrhizus]|nr:aspartic peptidase domain-containing protein [Pisolithus croceorrhizus]